jgi:hypothetical protein
MPNSSNDVSAVDKADAALDPICFANEDHYKLFQIKYFNRETKLKQSYPVRKTRKILAPNSGRLVRSSRLRVRLSPTPAASRPPPHRARPLTDHLGIRPDIAELVLRPRR